MDLSARRSASVLLVVGALGFSGADLMRKLLLPSNQAVSAADTVRHVQAHPGLWLLAGVAMLLGSMIMTPAVATLSRSVTGRGRGLTRAGGLLLCVGLVASTGHALAFYGMAGAAAASGAPVPAYQSIEDESNRYPLFLLVIVLFVIGMVVGTVLLAIGLRRAGRVRIWVPVAAVAFALTGTLGSVASGVVGVAAALATFAPMAGVLAWGTQSQAASGAEDVPAVVP